MVFSALAGRYGGAGDGQRSQLDHAAMFARAKKVRDEQYGNRPTDPSISHNEPLAIIQRERGPGQTPDFGVRASWDGAVRLVLFERVVPNLLRQNSG